MKGSNPMYTTDELYKALSNGADPNDLAADFTRSLNEAMAQRAEERKKTEALTKRASLAAEALTLLRSYGETFDPPIPLDNTTADEIEEMLDNIFNLAKALSEIPKLTSSADSDDATLSSFLASLGL